MSFEQASHYTLDQKLKALLLDCSKNRWPTQFHMEGNKIRTNKGRLHAMPRDPMDLCNLIHDILCDQDIPSIISIPESRQSRRSMGDTFGVSAAAIYAYAEHETKRLALGDLHREKLSGCIFTGVLIGHLEIDDFVLDGESILSIRGIDTMIPDLVSKV